MAAIPGVRFDITGASGSQGLLAPKSGWRAYILPRGGYAASASTGTQITFDSAAIAGRFAANDWIQAGLNVSNIRQVSAVGGNSLTVAGSALTVAENDRIFLFGSTEPTVTGGSATYVTPNTVIRHRDDDAADTYTNSMVTSGTNGDVQFFSLPAVYDVLIQDSNQTNQGFIVDLPVGVAEGISTTQHVILGATVTINATLGVTGWATFGQTVTMNANAGVTGTFTVGGALTANSTLGVTGVATLSGRAAFGNSVSIDGALGVTGNALFGGTVTVGGAIGVTGNGLIGGSLTVNGALGVTGTITGTSTVLTNDLRCRRILLNNGTTASVSAFSLSSTWGSSASVSLSIGNVQDSRGIFQVLSSGTGQSDNPTITYYYQSGTFSALPYMFVQRVTNGALTAGLTTVVTLAAGTSSAVITYRGLPVDTETYAFAWIMVG